MYYNEILLWKLLTQSQNNRFIQITIYYHANTLSEHMTALNKIILFIISICQLYSILPSEYKLVAS